MIKVELSQRKVESEGYPYYGVSDSGTIVLFDCGNQGVCIKQGDTYCQIGQRQVWNLKCFTRINGTITITQD